MHPNILEMEFPGPQYPETGLKPITPSFLGKGVQKKVPAWGAANKGRIGTLLLGSKVLPSKILVRYWET